MKKILLLFLLFGHFLSNAQTVVDPHTFPQETNPNNSNFEFYSRALGSNKRATFNNVRKNMSPGIVAVGFTPSPSGNTTNFGDFVLDPSDALWYIAYSGDAVQLPYNTPFSAGTGISISGGNVITNTGDLSNTNELQTISIAGQNLTLSNGGGTVTIPAGAIYTAGTGITILSNVVTNTGDLSATNEGLLSLSPGTDTTAIINSNTSGSPSLTILVRGGLSIDETGNTIILEGGAGDGVSSVTGTDGNGFDITVVNPTTAPEISIATTVTGITYGSLGELDAVTVGYGLDFTAPTLRVDTSEVATPYDLSLIDRGFVSTSDGTSHTVTLTPGGGSFKLVEGSNITLTTSGTADDGIITIASTGGGGSGTVEDFIFTDGNGFNGTVSTSTTTPTLELETTVTGLIYGGSGDLLPVTIGSGLSFSAPTLSAVDVSATNELQTISTGTNTLALSNSGGTVTVDTDPTNDITSGSTAGGDLSGTYPNPTVDGLQGRAVSATAPTSNQVLKWNGSAWEPATDDTGGGGVTDGDKGDVVVSGSGATWTVEGLQGRAVASTAPTTDQVLKWNGTSWIPGEDLGPTGTGVNGQVVIWSGTNSQYGTNDFFWNNTTKRLGIGTASPTAPVHVVYTGVGNETTRGLSLQDLASAGTPTWRWVPGYPGQYDGGLVLMRNTTTYQGVTAGGITQYFTGLEISENQKIGPIQHPNSWVKFVQSGSTRYMELHGWDDLSISQGFGAYRNFFKASGYIGFGEINPAAKLELKGIGATSGTYTFRSKNSSNQFSFSLRDDRAVIFDNLSGTGTRLMQLDATGIATRSSIDPTTLATGNIYTTNGSLTGTRTVIMANNELTFLTDNNSGTYPGMSIQTYSDGTTNNRYLSFKDHLSTTRLYIEGQSTNNLIRSQNGDLTMSGLAKVALSAGSSGGGFKTAQWTDDGRLVLPSSTPSSPAGGSVWYGSDSKIKYRESGSTRSVASIEGDVTGNSLQLITANNTPGGDNLTYRFDANAGAFTVTLDATLQEGRWYTMRCTRNATNIVTFNAGSGFSLAIDGDSTLTPSSLAAGGAGTGMSAPYRIYSVRRMDTIIYIK